MHWFQVAVIKAITKNISVAYYIKIKYWTTAKSKVKILAIMQNSLNFADKISYTLKSSTILHVHS